MCYLQRCTDYKTKSSNSKQHLYRKYKEVKNKKMYLKPSELQSQQKQMLHISHINVKDFPSFL
jgi:hypothetical protein